MPAKRLNKVDEKKTFLVKGSLLNQIVSAINAFNNLDVKWGPSGSQPTFTPGELRSILSIPLYGAAGGSGTDSTRSSLVLTDTSPYGDVIDEEDENEYGWVTWGVVNNLVVSGIANAFVLADGKQVWIKVTTNGASPLSVLTASLETGASIPDDIGGSATNPPTTAHFLLGEVSGTGSESDPFLLNSTGSGSLRLSLEASGFQCVLATAGDPEADPPVEPDAGGVRTNYQLKWDRVTSV